MSSALSQRSASKLDAAALAALMGFVASIQFSIAVAQSLLAVTTALWVGLLIVERERPELPRAFWPLGLYGGWTLVASALSLQPLTSFSDSKQLALFAIVPIVYRLSRGARAETLALVIISAGAVSAVVGIAQYGILEYDNLGRRPQGALTHYMTYAGALMLVTGLAGARLLFRREDRAWPALVTPALLVALALTLTRSAWVGTCAGLGLLLVLKDRRLLAALPVVAALLFALAPASVTDRVYSTFDLQDPTNRDRFAMARAGLRIIGDHPIAGVGPDVIKDVYPAYRDSAAVEPVNPHLHNVPMQIAAERGLPALAIWLWFLSNLVTGLSGRLRASQYPALAAGGLAALASMLAAGMFEYNFGDSEFLMLWLVLVTLPYAADSSPGASTP